MKRTLNFLANMVVAVLIGWTVLMVFNKAPNPLDRFFEISAGSYRALSDGYVDGSDRYKIAVREAMASDGKITLATYPAIFDLWMKSINNSYTFDNSITNTPAERERLKQLTNTK
jgi:hypothetical protein